MILREYSVCQGFPCRTVSSIQERKGDSFLISVSLTRLQQKSLCSRFRRENEQQQQYRSPPFCSASIREGRVALIVGHPRGTHSRYVTGCCLIPIGICGLKNISRRITYGIGCVWGMPSLSPLSSLAACQYENGQSDRESVQKEQWVLDFMLVLSTARLCSLNLSLRRRLVSPTVDSR